MWMLCIYSFGNLRAGRGVRYIYLLIAAENISGRIHKKLLTLLLGRGISWLRRLHCIYFDPFWTLNHVNVLPIQKIKLTTKLEN